MNELTLQINIEHNHPQPEWVKEKAINTIANRLLLIKDNLRKAGLKLEYDILTPNTRTTTNWAEETIQLKEETEQ